MAELALLTPYMCRVGIGYHNFVRGYLEVFAFGFYVGWGRGFCMMRVGERLASFFLELRLNETVVARIVVMKVAILWGVYLCNIPFSGCVTLEERCTY